MTPIKTDRPEVTVESISQAAGLIKKSRPSYGPIIEFYSQVFIAQEKSRQTLSLDPIVIEPDLLTLKFDNQMPLIDTSQFVIDKEKARLLFKDLCHLAAHQAPKLARAAEKMEKNLSHIDFDSLYTAILINRHDDIKKTAEKLEIKGHVLMFFVFLSMSPSLQFSSAQLSSYLKDTPELKKGYCPICGSHPNFAFLDHDGNRYLMCSMCNHEWLSRRMGCVYCDSSDTRLQQYFFNEEEQEYRVYLCDNCQNYLKVIDLRKLDRVFVPKLEQIATLHLDLKAREKGYKTVNPGPTI